MTPHRVQRPTLACVTLLTALACVSCTAGSDAKSPAGPSSAAPSASAPSSPAVRSSPLRVEVTHVAGRLSPAARRALSRRVGATLSTYSDAAFLAGAYPRRGFTGALRSFTAGVAPTARRDQALLTNSPLGPTTTAVHATRRTAYLSVLAPKAAVAGVTAAVDLRFVVDRGRRPAQRVRLKGRLLLTRVDGSDKTGAWKIFGYDLSRSTTPVGS